jgi:NAD(P)-dependent dehydrogenase (short-subunit alcohol dehydrogenase family)
MGGAGGIGRAASAGLLAAGASILVSDLNESAGAAAADAFAREFGTDRVLFRQADVRQPAQIEQAIADAVARWNGIDILVNVVGVNVAKPIERVTDEDFAHIVNTNLRGTFAAIRCAVPHLRRSGRGSIINIGSIHGEMGFGDHHLYTMCKAGLNGMTREMAFTFGPDRIRINVVAPGYITPRRDPAEITASLKPEAVDEFWRDWASLYPVYDAFTQPLRRSCHAEDVANAVVFLASDMSRCITGEVLHVDGGIHTAMFRYAGRPDYVQAAKDADQRWKAWYEAHKA